MYFLHTKDRMILPKKSYTNLFIFCFLLFCICAFNKSLASNVSLDLNVQGEDIVNGSIVSFDNDNYVLSSTPYDRSMIGVAELDPILSLDNILLQDGTFVTTSGDVNVRVSAINGPIEVGDYITSSEIPGVGQKAQISGQVVGKALEPFNPQDPNEVAELLVNVNVTTALVSESVPNDLLGMLRTGLQVPIVTPLTTLRYIIAALVALIAFTLGFSTFGRVTSNSVEALGRNPLASRIIKSAVVLNFVFTVGVIAVGLLIAYLVLSL